MQETPQGPAEPEQPPVPGTEVSPDPVSTGTGPDDVAPDADDPGDDLPTELEEHVHEGDVQPDEVDQKEVQEPAAPPYPPQQDSPRDFG